MRIQRLRRFLPLVVGQSPVCRFVTLLMLLVLIVMGLPALSDAQPTCPPDGDVDQNGSVTAADALLAFQQALSLAQLTACQQTIADVFPLPTTPDGNITASDALCIFQKALSLPSCLDALPSSNRPPVVDAGADQSVAAGMMVILSGTASDADGTLASHAWTQTGGTTVSLSGADTAMAAFTTPDVTADVTLTFRLTVRDDAGAQTSDEVRVTVRPVEQDSLEVSVLGEGGIRVASEGNPLDCGAVTVCRGQFDVGSEVVLEAVPASGWRHAAWTGCDETASGRCTVFMDDDRIVSVTFVSAEPQVAGEVFRQHISGLIVQTKCVNCHVQGGASGNTRLVFVRATDTPDHEALNLRAFEDLLAKVADEGGGSYILNKIQGVGHGGGVQVPAGSPDFANMQRFLGLLGEDVAPPAPVTVETLFDTVTMASPRKTLRRAALIFAGRIPTDAEYAAVEGGDESVLRATIRGLMEGPQFHEFLIRASNDRLLTDRRGSVIDHHAGYLVDFTNDAYRRYKAAHVSGDYSELLAWRDRVQFGFRRAPLELVAYVVENDLPYTEILTADYIMANPWAAAAYGASTRFDDPMDPYEFQPSQIVNYYRKGEGYEIENDRVIGANRVINPGPLITDYPHAGILNTTAFLLRYPTTATNRNRARSRWTYYHFLGLDIEKSASRTTDPVALADTNNPTMHNPNCTVCHGVLDPVAGAFQNYDDVGQYKSEWRGLDSLDEFYKYDPSGRRDFAVSQRSREGGTTFLGTVRLFAGRDNELGLKNLRTFEGDYKLRFWLGEVVVRTLNGDVIDRYQTRDAVADEACGAPDSERYLLWDCREVLVLPLVVQRDGDYSVEIEVWVLQEGEQAATLQVWMPGPFYRKGDTWYLDVRMPGFADATAPNPDNSVQWLAQQIVADERFAEATVKFWWPAIMGSEIAEFPEDAADAGFEGQLLAANAQDAEVVRLADGFRRGFQGSPYGYNLKDLLVEIVMSKWFRADAIIDADPVRRVALRNAGAKRLLTPEELARKTAAITGVQWGRRISSGPRYGRWHNALTDAYRLIYGGIDSDGVTERAQDITSVMAGVSKRHAAEVSCPVVMREIYLLPDADRRLLAGVASVRELGAKFEIEADFRAAPQTLSLSGALTAGSKSVRLTYTNSRPGRIVRLDRLDVRDASGRPVSSHEIEDVEWSGGDCNGPQDNHFSMRCAGSIEVPIKSITAGNYAVEVVAWADQAGDELPRLNITVLDMEGTDSSADAIRRKLVELHDKLLGVQVTPDSPDVEAAYQLFVDVRERKRASNDEWFRYYRCSFTNDHFYFDGILDDAVVEKENERGDRYYGTDWDRVNGLLESIDFSDPDYTAQAWVVVLAAMMMDYRYLYL